MTEGELLYYELEAPPASQPPKQYVLLDASPGTWGIPRLAGSAVALSVMNRARERRADATIFGAGRRRPAVHGTGSRVRDSRTPGSPALGGRPDRRSPRAVDARDAGDQGAPHRSRSLPLHGSRPLQEIHDWARSSDLPSGVRLHVFASDQINGRATLWRRESGAFVPLSTLSLAIRDLLPEPEPQPIPAAPVPAVAFRTTTGR